MGHVVRWRSSASVMVHRGSARSHVLVVLVHHWTEVAWMMHGHRWRMTAVVGIDGRSPTIGWRWSIVDAIVVRSARAGLLVLVLGTRGLDDGLDDGWFVVEHDTRFGVFRLASVVRRAEADVGDAFVQIVRNANAKVTEALELAIEGLFDELVGGLVVEGADAENLIWGRDTTCIL